MVKLNTGIKELDALVEGGIESGSRNTLCCSPGIGKTVFAMQFLWQGLKQGETVAYDVMDRLFPRLLAYFKSFVWNIEPYLDKQKFIAVQAFPRFSSDPKDHRVIHFSLDDLQEMKRIDKLISGRPVTRFAAGDSSEQSLSLYDLRYMNSGEQWTISWCHYDDIVNIDIMTTATQKDDMTERAADLDLNTTHNIIYFRFNERKCQRELRIVKMEGCSHPPRWLPFRITNKGIELARKR